MRRAHMFVSLPPCLLAVVLGTALLQESCGYHSFWENDRLNLAEAAATRDVPEVERLLRDGADIHARYQLRPGLISDESPTMTPLEAALAVNDAEVVTILLRHGHVDERDLTSATCADLASACDAVIQARTSGP